MAWTFFLMLLAGSPQVVFQSGILPERGRIAAKDLALGPEDSEDPRASEEKHAGRDSEGGAFRVVAGPGGVEVFGPRGARLRLDEIGRVLAEGRALTRPAARSSLGLPDGSLIHLRAGSSRRGIREAWLQKGAELRRLYPNERGRGFRASDWRGPRTYWLLGGRALFALSSFGPFLVARPLARRGVEVEAKVLFLADLARRAVHELRLRTNSRSIQHPLAYKQASVLEARFFAWYPPGLPKRLLCPVAEDQGLLLPAGDRARWVFRAAGPIPRRGLWTPLLSLHPGPEAPPALEFRLGPRRASLVRVLPPTLQQRSRTFGRGVDLDALAAKRLPWPGPLDGPRQHERALDLLRPLVAGGPPAATPGR